MKNRISIDDVICRIQQAQTVLSLWLNTMTTDDGEDPDIVGAVMTILDGLADALAVESEKQAGLSAQERANETSVQ